MSGSGSAPERRRTAHRDADGMHIARAEGRQLSRLLQPRDLLQGQGQHLALPYGRHLHTVHRVRFAPLAAEPESKHTVQKSGGDALVLADESSVGSLAMSDGSTLDIRADQTFVGGSSLSGAVPLPHRAALRLFSRGKARGHPPPSLTARAPLAAAQAPGEEILSFATRHLEKIVVFFLTRLQANDILPPSTEADVKWSPGREGALFIG